jgi:putative DNA primase/helicase
MLSKYTPYEISYEEPTRWLQFLNEVFEGDDTIIKYVQKAMGYSMTGSTKEEIMFILLGDGSNGKSVLLETFNEALGDYGATSNVEILLERKYGSKENKGDIARLNGLRQVTTEEPSLGDKMNESAIKTMTSGSGKIVARHLYANEFEFSPKMKIWMAANYKPTIRGTDHGIWRRIRMIPFEVTFDERKQDKDLKDKLKQEIPQILGWMMNGCLLWQKEGLKEPKKLKKAQHDYRAEMDVVQKWIDEVCVLAPTAREKSSVLFDNFSNYVKTNKEFQLSHTMFGRNMGKKFKKRVYMGVTEYIGIRIRENGSSVLSEEEKAKV